ncbi:MAG: DUF2997 domain-containing protein [Chloroflexi bacterium]|nr:DUF2997 domain-containing protein [Chloroflexota bacterium]
MPEIEFCLDTKSGELSLRVRGVLGPACDDVARLAKELLGEPAHDQATADMYAQVSVKPRVQGRLGPCGR